MLQYPCKEDKAYGSADIYEMDQGTDSHSDYFAGGVAAGLHMLHLHLGGAFLRCAAGGAGSSGKGHSLPYRDAESYFVAPCRRDTEKCGIAGSGGHAGNSPAHSSAA